MNDRVLVYLDPQELMVIKARYSAGDAAVNKSVAELSAEADALLAFAPASVMNKTGVAASGNPHDFYSIGGYSWPNPTTKDGLPYQYRDSETNPEALKSKEFDKGPYEEMTRRVATLSLAYYYRDDVRYANHAADLLRTWFIAPETRMNPHFRYAAARPGVWDGHFSGTIEGVFLIELLDFVSLIEGSAAWTDLDDRSLRSWFRDLSDWLANGKFGRREVYSTNNHSSYLLAQILAFSIYGGDVKRARRVIPLARRELGRQIRPDGSMPLEFARADGWFYSVYGLRAFVVLARLAEHFGADLWRERSAAISQSCASLAPYLTYSVAWPFSRGHKPWERDAVQVFHVASRAYSSADLLATATNIIDSAVEPLPHVDLLMARGRSFRGEAVTIPAARAWGPSDLTERWPISLGRRWTSRGLGVFAARGLWRGRYLR